jgi:hypothetical protein
MPGRSREPIRAAAGAVPMFVVLMVVVLGVGGCYSPKVGPGLACAEAPAKRCPDGFECANQLCVSVGGGTGGTGGAGLGGGSGGGGGTAGQGGTGGTCAKPIVSLCPVAAGAPAGCDPVCQNGCGCGLRCNVTLAGASCLAPLGAKVVGEACRPDADDCAPGLICQQEACGTNLGRCYRLCRDPSACVSSGVCSTFAVVSGGASAIQRICDLGDRTCDAFARTGCPDPALNCYVTGPNHTRCDCPGMQLAEGAACVHPNDCGAGLACLGVDGSLRCYKLCRNTTDCAACVTLGTAGGYCPL